MARSAQVAKIGREARQALSKLLSEVMLNAADAVEAASPVQTGHMLSNFVLSTGAPYTGVDGSPDAVSYAAQDAGRDAILNYDVGRDGKIYLANNVEYLKYQRPFLSEALQSAVRIAPHDRQTRVRSALKAMAGAAIRGGK